MRRTASPTCPRSSRRPAEEPGRAAVARRPDALRHRLLRRDGVHAPSAAGDVLIGEHTEARHPPRGALLRRERPRRVTVGERDGGRAGGDVRLRRATPPSSGAPPRSKPGRRSWLSAASPARRSRSPPGSGSTPAMPEGPGPLSFASRAPAASRSTSGGRSSRTAWSTCRRCGSTRRRARSRSPCRSRGRGRARVRIAEGRPGHARVTVDRPAARAKRQDCRPRGRGRARAPARRGPLRLLRRAPPPTPTSPGRRRAPGRLVRSPTVFEEVVKTICTTNCAWSATERMVGALVEHLGEPAVGAPDGPYGRAFPTPEAMAAADEGFYRDVVRAGYRGAYLRSLAADVADGRARPRGARTGEPRRASRRRPRRASCSRFRASGPTRPRTS